MLKINDLMIGDLVNLNENGEPDIRRVISLLEKDLVCVQRINETEHDMKTDTEIFPIELDENILKKFGFKMKRSDIIPFYFYNEEYDIPLSFKNNAYCIETYNTDIMFKYVHQFQHFLKMMGVPSEISCYEK